MATYLFDFDGTLVDSMPTYVSAMLRILDDNGIPYGDDLVKTITPLGVLGTAQYYIKLGINLPIETIVEQMKIYLLDGYLHTIPAKPHVAEALRTLKARGDDLHVLTASPHVTLDPCLERVGLASLFDNIWSCDDFGTTKADPEIYKMAAARIGKPVNEILFLDDNLSADQTAKIAGITVCGVYDESSKEYVDEIKAVTDHYIYDFSELPKLKF